jgi:hypothetical protein
MEMMPDLSFLAAFADHPITLVILCIAALVGLTLWKVAPYLKDMVKHVDTANVALTAKIDALIQSDAAQEAAISGLSEHVRLNTLDMLRLTVYNGAVDIEDRLVAARRYFLRGGNGKTAAYVRELVAQNPAAWKTILAMSSEEERTTLEGVVGA